MIYDPVEQGHDKYTIKVSEFIHFQLRENSSG